MTMSGIIPTAMKAIVLLCAVTLACLSLACTSLPGVSGSSADAEARREAEKFWATQITKCGDSYFRKEVLKKDNYVLYYQMKDTEILVTPNKVTEADRLNGIEWKGSTTFRPKATRVWGTEKGAWYEWKRGPGGVPELTYGLKKVNGRWEVNTERHRAREETSRYEPVDCSKIPQ